ncbi:MAG TPA: methyltransferase domain-containing protein, partial [Vicinamibacterales bacterium]|nr:methyltransferase domain-containing protein [Vicinamibacterales bacterium]
ASNGKVVGVDHSEIMLRQASRRNRAAIAACRVQLHLASAAALPPFSEPFDKVMASNVHMFLDDPVATLRRWLAITRPGGWVALQEVDWISWVCDPIHPAWTKLLSINAEIWGKRGMDVFVGRRLPGFLKKAGLTDVQSKIHTPVYRNTHPYQFLLLAFSKINRTEMIEKGYVTEAEYTDLTESLHAHLSDSGTFVTWSLFCQAWGRKPA